MLEERFYPGTTGQRKEKAMRGLIIGLAIICLLGPGMSQAQQIQQTSRDVVVESRTSETHYSRALHTQQTSRDLAVESSVSVGAAAASIVYFPVKVAVGVVGAILGGFGGFVTGGNERTAEGIWRPLTGGTYFITPDVLEGQQPFLPFDGGPYTGPFADPYVESMYVQP